MCIEYIDTVMEEFEREINNTTNTDKMLKSTMWNCFNKRGIGELTTILVSILKRG